VPGGFEIAGLLRPDEVAQATGHPLPSSGVYETVGGLVMHALGRLPREGDRVEVDGVALTVLQMADRRVARVLLSPPDHPGTDPS
jgi:CBS domain containing-hemolysin-like protein